MTSKRRGFLTSGLLTGALLLGTAGLALAHDPASTPTASPSGIGQNGFGMMGGQNGSSMMGGQNGSSMMGGQMGTMSADQLKRMATLHDEMVKSGGNPLQMQQFHAQHHSGR